MESRKNRLLAKYKVNKEDIPKSLFKYYAINSNLTDALEKSSIWFSNPRIFNDPFDCNINSNYTEKPEELEKYFTKYSKKYTFKPEEKWEELKKSQFKDLELAKELTQVAVKKMINSISILCLSSKHDNILMWSHYTTNHKGLCIEFSTENEVFFRKPLVVKYKKEQPLLSYLKDRDKFIIDLLTIKSDDWSYENEYRLIEDNDIDETKGGKLYPIPPSSVKAIYFGCQCNEGDIKKIIGIAKEKFPHTVRFYKMKLNSKNYKLDSEEISCPSLNSSIIYSEVIK